MLTSIYQGGLPHLQISRILLIHHTPLQRKNNNNNNKNNKQKQTHATNIQKSDCAMFLMVDPCL